jgi:uncharacterized protein
LRIPATIEHCDLLNLSIRVNDSTTNTPTVWAISDGAAGNARQALALAQAIGSDPRIVTVELRNPWRALAPRFTVASRLALPSSLRWQFAPPWPDFAIGCGRQAALLTRMLRTWSGGRTFTAQILDPRVDPSLFDVIVAPQHDASTAPNAIVTTGALNSIDDVWLADAAKEFANLQQLPQPRTAILVGGPRQGLGLDAKWLDEMIARLQQWLAREHGSLLITISRRTPEEWTQRLRGAFHNGCAYFWTGKRDGVNPYAGYLAYADRIVVTPDSVNMLSEACATGKPVFTLLPKTAQGKLVTFHARLKERGLVQELNADDSMFTPTDSLRETPVVAARIVELRHARQNPSRPIEVQPEAVSDG